MTQAIDQLVGVREPEPPRTEAEKEQARNLPHKLELSTAIGVLGIWLGSLTTTLSEQLSQHGLPDLQGAFSIGPDHGQWIQTGFLMAEIAVTPLAPFFAQVFSVRRLELACLFLFALTSLAIPLSPGIGTLLVLRIVQGMSAGPLVPLLLMTVIRTFPPYLRGIGVAFYALAETFNPTIAPLLSGHLVQWGGWEWLFWVNVPLLCLAMAAVWFGLPKSKPQWAMLDRMDTFGMLALVIGLAALVAGLAQGTRYNWTDSGLVVGLLLIAAVMLATFVVQEFISDHPLIDFRYLATPNLGTTVAVLLMFTIALLGPTYLIPEFLARVAGYRPEQTGAILVWTALPQLVLVPLTVLLCRVIDVRLVIATGWFLLALAYYLDTYLTVDWRAEDFILTQLAFTLGLAFVMVALLTVTTNSVQPAQAPTISSLFNLIRTIGTTLGSGIIAGLVTIRERIHAYYLTAQLGQDQAGRPAADAGQAIAANAATLSFADGFGMVGIMCVFAIATLIFLDEVRVPLHPPRDEPS